MTILMNGQYQFLLGKNKYFQTEKSDFSGLAKK